MYFPKIEMTNNPANIFQLSFGKINSLWEKLISLFFETLLASFSSFYWG